LVARCLKRVVKDPCSNTARTPIDIFCPYSFFEPFFFFFLTFHKVSIFLSLLFYINRADLQDHYNNFGENVLESGQHYYVEDGHIIYDNAPADVDAATIAFYNGNANTLSGSNRRKNSSANASSERLPSSRWSPATASTTITAAEDDESSSSKHQVIIFLLLAGFFYWMHRKSVE